MGTLDTLYEIVGNRFPLISQIVACAIGAIVFGFGWYSIGRHFRNEQARIANLPTVRASSPPTPLQLVQGDTPSPTPTPSTTSIAKRPQKRMTAAQRERQRIDRALRSKS